nr:hypothetical protein [uncultured Flavobacterium sp.]
MPRNLNLLIITSTVSVNSCLTVLIDPKIRLQQYVDSILFYLNSKKIDRIIVCDNSGFDYSVVDKINAKAISNNKLIEFLNFHGSEKKIKEFGKGFGEGEIMNYVFANSKFIQNETSFYKVTGRIQVLNIDSVIRKVDASVNYFQMIGINPFNVVNKVDTRFYHCTVNAFKEYLLISYPFVQDNEGFFLEHVYYNALNSRNVIYKNFNILPNIKGISGSTGVSYDIKPLRWFVSKNIYSIFKFLNVLK